MPKPVPFASANCQLFNTKAGALSNPTTLVKTKGMCLGRVLIELKFPYALFHTKTDIYNK